MERISFALQEQPKETYIVKAMELYSKIGLLNQDNLENFLSGLKWMAEKQSPQRPHGLGLFDQKAATAFDLRDARQQLEQYLSQQDHQKKYGH